MDTTTKLRLLLSNVIADAGEMRSAIATEVWNVPDASYLLLEVDRIQAAAHRIVAFLGHDVIESPRN